jgi:hypothetical protein
VLSSCWGCICGNSRGLSFTTHCCLLPKLTVREFITPPFHTSSQGDNISFILNYQKSAYPVFDAVLRSRRHISYSYIICLTHSHNLRSLTRCLIGYSPHSLTHSLPYTLPHFLTNALPPHLLHHSLINSLTPLHSLFPSLTHSLFTHSITHSLTPLHTPSFPH